MTDMTNTTSTTSTTNRNLPWRGLVAAAGLLTFVGGSMHPQAPDGLGFEDELVHMMKSDQWVPGHGLLTIGAAMLLVGLVLIRRAGRWPEAAGLLRYAIVATAVYTAELVFHTAAVVDRDALVDGDFGPIITTHLALAFVAYPLFGVATALLGARFVRTWAAPMKPLAVLGIVAGIANGLAAPLVIGFQDPAFSPLFAIGGIGTAAFYLAAGLAGLRQPAEAPVAASMAVASA